MNYQYISADCGSGKTRGITNYIIENPDLYILVFPTIKLLEQQLKHFKKSSYSRRAIKAIYTDNCCGSVGVEVNQFLRQNSIDPKQLLLVTHKTLFNIDADNFYGWNVVIDEAPEVTYSGEINIKPANRVVLHNLIKSRNQTGEFTEITFNDLSAIDTDDCEQLIVEKLLKISNYEEVLFSQNFFDRQTDLKLVYGCYNGPDRFAQAKSVLCMGNCFEHSVVYKAWQLYGVCWQKSELDIGLSKRIMPLSARIDARYFSKHPITRSLLWKQKDTLAKIGAEIDRRHKPDSFIWIKNNQDLVKLSGKQISAYSHGINDYQHYETVAWLATMKPSHSERKFYQEFFGINADEIIRAREFEMLYQSVCRSNLRDFDSTATVVVYCLDQKQANFLTATPTYIDIGLTAPVKNKPGPKESGAAVTKAIRTKVCRLRKKKKAGTIQPKQLTELRKLELTYYRAA